MEAANAVLDVIETEKLYLHVNEVSKYLLGELERLKDKHHIIGDIRGYGYFIGIDFVTDRETREPATKKAALILRRFVNSLFLPTVKPRLLALD
jgi:4-aminobutyrate aminotransferase-like enzyme